MLYTIVAIVALTSIISLSVDYGRVQSAKTELQNAVDAAARYAVTGVADNTYVTKAQQAAAQNIVDGMALTLQTGDIVAGTWNSNTRAFTPGGGSPNAIRIVGQRTAARGNAIPLMFAKVLGPDECDVIAQSIVLFTGSTSSVSTDVAGTNSVTISGSGQIKRWASESGTVTVASNGTYSLSWGQYIYGDVLYRGTAPNPPGNGITGSKTAMAADIAYAAPAVPNDTPNLTVNWANGTTVSQSGTHQTSSVNIGGGATVNLTGDLTLYCSGTATIGGGANINTNGTARKFTLYQTGTGQVTLNMSSPIYMRIYAPQSTVRLSGSTPFIGSIVAKDLIVEGSASLSYSSALPAPINPTGGGGSGDDSGSDGVISMVE